MTLVPFDDRDGWIWWDGSLVPWHDANLHVLSHGLYYASTVFEGERAYGRNIFRTRRSVMALARSLQITVIEREIAAAGVAPVRGELDRYRDGCPTRLHRAYRACLSGAKETDL